MTTHIVPTGIDAPAKEVICQVSVNVDPEARASGADNAQTCSSPRHFEARSPSGAEHPAATVALSVESDDKDEDSRLCIICFERTADHVLLHCGHGGFCKMCACRLLVRPPHQCPSCRALVFGAVYASPSTAIGGHADIPALQRDIPAPA